MRHLGSRGGSKSRIAAKVLNNLGPLESLADAMRWLEVSGRAVAVGGLPSRTGHVLARTVETWMKLYLQERNRIAEEDRTPTTWVELMIAAEKEMANSSDGDALEAIA